MKHEKTRRPALLLAVTLLLASTPVISGGRDVPDNISESSSQTGTSDPHPQCPSDSSTQITLAGLSMDVAVDKDGHVTVQPSLVRQAGALIRLVLLPEPQDSCPAD